MRISVFGLRRPGTGEMLQLLPTTSPCYWLLLRLGLASRPCCVLKAGPGLPLRGGGLSGVSKSLFGAGGGGSATALAWKLAAKWWAVSARLRLVGQRTQAGRPAEG